MKNKIKDVLTRAAKTFWQAAVAYIVAAIGTQLQLPQEAAAFLLGKTEGKDGARQLRRLAAFLHMY